MSFEPISKEMFYEYVVNRKHLDTVYDGCAEILKKKEDAKEVQKQKYQQRQLIHKDKMTNDPEYREKFMSKRREDIARLQKEEDERKKEEEELKSEIAPPVHTVRHSLKAYERLNSMF
jgi:gas vesicle protein